MELSNVSVSYGKNLCVRKVSHRFANGRFTALVGPNGCGKSTLLRALMGLLPMQQGEARLDDQPVHAMGRRSLARRVAYLPQDNHCPDYITLGELIELSAFSRSRLMRGPSASDQALFRDALQTVGLLDMAHRPLNTLSGGQRQRAWIAMVLAQDADLILMDEPVNHLDVAYQYSVLNLVARLTRQRGKTVICVLHDLNLTASFADEVVLMRDGRIEAAGPVRETVTADNVTRTFGMEAEIFDRNGRLVCLPHATEFSA
nr:ABC transporter ATP-binding protein [Ruegeria sp. Ofav3-42]